MENISKTIKMVLEDIGRFIERKITVKGRKYSQFIIYIPRLLALDSNFPFRPGDKLLIRVQGNKLVIEKA
ncbi:MAG: hypothetical protein DRJ47_06985 [Thermoprotei archaeon]|nr:MAG: hypothetical protein DRJ47_06985 [Thermoprotei archaeon]